MSEPNPKDAFGDLKPDLSLVPSGMLIPVAIVMGLGKRKYGAYNWRDKAVRASVYLAAAMRHLQEFQDGLDKDEQSGQSPLAHAASCMAVLLDAMAVGCWVDDRPIKGAAHRLIGEAERGAKPKPPLWQADAQGRLAPVPEPDPSLFNHAVALDDTLVTGYGRPGSAGGAAPASPPSPLAPSPAPGFVWNHVGDDDAYR